MSDSIQIKASGHVSARVRPDFNTNKIYKIYTMFMLLFILFFFLLNYANYD